MDKEFTTVDTYIASFPKETQAILQKVRRVVRDAAPTAQESIAYAMPAYKIDGKPLVYFGGWAEHIGFYATPSGHVAFQQELAPYKGAKGSVKFPLSQPIPYDLIKRMVEYRVKEVK